MSPVFRNISHKEYHSSRTTLSKCSRGQAVAATYLNKRTISRTLPRNSMHLQLVVPIRLLPVVVATSQVVHSSNLSIQTPTIRDWGHLKTALHGRPLLKVVSHKIRFSSLRDTLIKTLLQAKHLSIDSSKTNSSRSKRKVTRCLKVCQRCSKRDRRPGSQIL